MFLVSDKPKEPISAFLKCGRFAREICIQFAFSWATLQPYHAYISEGLKTSSTQSKLFSPTIYCVVVQWTAFLHGTKRINISIFICISKLLKFFQTWWDYCDLLLHLHTERHVCCTIIPLQWVQILINTFPKVITRGKKTSNLKAPSALGPGEAK